MVDNSWKYWPGATNKDSRSFWIEMYAFSQIRSSKLSSSNLTVFSCCSTLPSPLAIPLNPPLPWSPHHCLELQSHLFETSSHTAPGKPADVLKLGLCSTALRVSVQLSGLMCFNGFLSRSCLCETVASWTGQILVTGLPCCVGWGDPWQMSKSLG